MSRQALNLTGQRFGKLTAIKRTGSDKYNKALWECLCDCGQTKVIVGSSLKAGKTTSCGCLRTELISSRITDYNTNRRLPEGQAARNRLINNYYGGAKRRGYTWALTVEQCVIFFKSICYYCGSPPSQTYRDSHYFGTYQYSGIDRVDNAKGYTIDNCVSCCEFCNRAKGSRTLQEFENYLDQLVRHRSNK